MNEESLTPEAELASAALDNEVTVAERVRVDSTPALAEQRAFYADLRSRLGDVTVTAASRATALAAALAEFDEMLVGEQAVGGATAGGSAARAPGAVVAPVLALRARRQRQYRWLGGAVAAAFALVVALGVVNSGNDDHDDTSTAATADDRKTAATAAAQGQAAEPVGDATMSAEAGSAGAATAAPAADQPGDGYDEFEINGPGTVTAWASAPSLETPEELVEFATSERFGVDVRAAVETTAAASDSVANTSAVPAPAAPAEASSDPSVSTCAASSRGPFAAAFYEGRQVIVVRDDLAAEILIVDPFSCEILDTIRLP